MMNLKDLQALRTKELAPPIPCEPCQAELGSDIDEFVDVEEDDFEEEAQQWQEAIFLLKKAGMSLTGTSLGADIMEFLSYLEAE